MDAFKAKSLIINYDFKYKVKIIMIDIVQAKIICECLVKKNVNLMNILEKSIDLEFFLKKKLFLYQGFFYE